jgi:hypothetical protein
MQCTVKKSWEWVGRGEGTHRCAPLTATAASEVRAPASGSWDSSHSDSSSAAGRLLGVGSWCSQWQSVLHCSGLAHERV